MQGDVHSFSEKLTYKLDHFAQTISPVSNQAKHIGKALYDIYLGSKEFLISENRNAFVRMKQHAEFWKPDELYRYVQVMPVHNEREIVGLLRGNSHFLQTAVVAIPDNQIKPILQLFGPTGVSNIHYPGSAPLLNVFEEPHDCDFDFLKIRYPYTIRFSATNFKSNRDWLEE